MVSKNDFHYWDLILKTEVQLLIFIRTNRERNFPLYIESLESLMYIFSAHDHYNYSRWASIHLRDMKSLPGCAEESFCHNGLLQKTTDFQPYHLIRHMKKKTRK